MATDQFEAEVMKWRAERNERFRTNEKSWLGLAGLFWLKEGDNTFGSDAGCNFVLPDSAPAQAGVLQLKGGLVYLVVEPGISLTCNGGELPAKALKDDQKDNPDFLELGRLILVVLKRGKSTLLRVWDLDHPARNAFSALNFYPYKPEYRLEAKYEGYAPFKLVRLEDIIGETNNTKMIGVVTFKLKNIEYRLEAEDGGTGLFIAMRDLTSGKTTYPGGRYLLTEKPENGKVILDFNQAFNMPCAYTLYATCVLPSKNNYLPTPIEAGEMKYTEGH